MKPDVEVVRYQEEHQEQVLLLQQHLWSQDLALNRAYFAWKYQHNPYLRSPTIALALHRGEVVGMRGLVGARWQPGGSGQPMDIPFADDLVVAPAFRGKGLSGRLVRTTCAYARELGYAFVLSLRGGQLTVLDSLAAGFQSIGAMEPVGRLRPPGAGQRFRERLRATRLLWRLTDLEWLRPASDRQPYRRLDERLGRGARRPSGARATPKADVAAMVDLAKRLPPDGRIGHVHDHEYFEWVFSNPRLEYRFLYWGSEPLDGYLVLHRELPPRKGPVTVWIADWTAVNETALRGLLEAAAEEGRFTRLGVWSATLPALAKAVVSDCGFEPIDLEARVRGRPAALIWPAEEGSSAQPLQADGYALRELATWRFRMLDQD